MTRGEELKNKRTIKYLSIVISCAIVLFAIGQVFREFSSTLEKELDESASDGIVETYKEVGQLISSISQSRVNYLRILGDYLDNMSIVENNNFEETVNKYKDLCGFTEFYFLNENGDFITFDGQQGYIDLGSNVALLSGDDSESAVIDGILPNKDQMVFYIVNVKDGSYLGFDYSSISFGYDKQDMVNALQIDAYNGDGISYIVYNTGKILCRIDTTTRASNIFTILDYSNISSEDYLKVQNDISIGNTGTIRIKGNGEIKDFGEFYFSYQALNYNDWTLVTLVPVENVTGTINTVRTQTTLVLSCVFGSILVVVALGLIFTFRSAIKDKDGLIIQRNIVFDLVCNNLDEIYILFNTKNQFVEYVSPNTEKLLGISHDDIYDNPQILKIYIDDKEVTLDKIITNSIYKHTSDYKKDVYIDALHGGKKILYSLSSYKPSNGLYAVIVLSDRTEENRIRQELQDALDGAKSANDAKTAFLSSVSHDMRTPMNAIVGFANLIEKDPYNGELVMRYINKIKLSSDHLLNLINEVLDFSKIEAGKTTLNAGATNITKIVNSVDSIIRPQALEKNQTFKLNTNYYKKCLVLADELRLSQILINILSNSIKYTDENGVIEFNVTSKKNKNYIRYIFEIKDNGIGMSEEFVKKIFEPFSREISSTTNKVQGTGLGMSITKNLIDLMGGTIEIKSKQGEGSTFIVTIDFELVENLDETINIDLKDVIDEDYSIKGLNILAAEDNDLNSEIIKALIEAEGANITVVSNGKECLEKFITSKENEFDLILMDVQMPIMDGYDATMNIRASSHPKAKTIPIIAMTANAFLEDVHNSLNSGMNAHVSKPIDIKFLKKTISECLNNKAN